MDVRYLILCLTTRCNLACAYCYHGEVPSGMDMSAEVLSKALRLAESGSESLHVQLTGGEPTLLPEVIIRTVETIRKFTRPVTIGIQTNATHFTPELVAFLKRHQVQVGVSLDGPPAIQDKLRGRAADTLKGIGLLEASETPFRVTTVLSRENVGQLDRLVLTLAGFQTARGIGLDLLVKKGRASTGMAPAEPVALQRGISAMLKTLSAVNGRRRIPLTLRELELLNRSQPLKKLPRVFCRAARGQSLAVTPDGRLFPCGQCLGDEAFAAGDVWHPEPERLTGLADYRLSNSECGNCPVNGRCPGDCPSRIYYNHGQDRNLSCVLYRTLWEKGKRQGLRIQGFEGPST